MAKKTGSALVKNSAFAKKSETESDSKKFGGAVVTRAKLLMDDAEKPKALGATKNKH